MTNYIFQFLWNQRDRYNGQNEYFSIIRDVCNQIVDLELLGIYEPVSEPWHWSFFVYTNQLEKWEEAYEEIRRRYSNCDNITQDITRIYVERYLNSKPSDIIHMKYLEIELNKWEGINKEIQSYYESIVQGFSEVTDCHYLGQYHPVSEPYSWAHLYLYKTVSQIKELDVRIYSKIGRPSNIQQFIERFYKKVNIKVTS